MCRSATTEGDQREVPRVVAAADRDQERVDRLLVRHADHARRGLDDRTSEPPRDRFVNRAGKVDVDWRWPPRK